MFIALLSFTRQHLARSKLFDIGALSLSIVLSGITVLFVSPSFRSFSVVTRSGHGVVECATGDIRVLFCPNDEICVGSAVKILCDFRIHVSNAENCKED